MNPARSLDIDELADIARTRWREAAERERTIPFELYVKSALRIRATRAVEGERTTRDRVLESGIAVRAWRVGMDTAGFAAASGHSPGPLRWVVDRACSYHAQTSPAAPSALDALPEVRSDLDPALPLPDLEELSDAVVARPHVRWAEAGETAEVLVSPRGWMTVRRRWRFWALTEGAAPRMAAQRGLENWGTLLDGLTERGCPPTQTVEGGPGRLLLTPDAASPVVAALTMAFHGPGSDRQPHCGEGWCVADEPTHPEGLSGGSFDDAGFPASARVLAEDGGWVGCLSGPGNYRRSSFREPPIESLSNLVFRKADSSLVGEPPGEVVTRCRVLRLSPVLWVLEMTMAAASGDDGRTRWLRIGPRDLLSRVIGGFGALRVTAEGPITPAIILRG